MTTAILTTIEKPKRFGYQFGRKRVLGLLILILAAVILWRVPLSISDTATTTLTLAVGPVSEVPHIVIPSLAYLTMAGLFMGVAGLAALLPLPSGGERLSTGLLAMAGVLIIPTILIAAAVGRETNILTLIVESFQLATPIVIGAMAGIWCERAGVFNIGLEGMMLFSACFGFTALFFLRPLFPNDQVVIAQMIGVGVAMLTGLLISMLHAWLSITFGTDQTVSGTVINILAVGVTSFVRRQYLLSNTGGFPTLPAIAIPILSQIPIIGPAFFVNKPIFLSMFVLVIGSYIVLFQTRFGLRVRAVGEHPSAADTLGISVNRIRWQSVMIGGLIAGLGGAWFSLESSGQFNDSMTSGAGFIALAAMIFGKWHPFGAFAGALLFGFASALGTRLQIMGVTVPVQFLQMVPYIVTLVVLAGLVGRAVGPKAGGIPYKKEGR